MEVFFRVARWVTQAVVFVPKCTANSIIIATVPIIGLFLIKGLGNEVSGLVDSLTPKNEYFTYALFSPVVLVLTSHLNNRVKRKKVRIKLKQCTHINHTKLTIVWLIVGSVRRMSSLLARAAAVLSETFFGLVTTLAGIYIAYLFHMIFWGKGLCVDNMEQILSSIKLIAIYIWGAAMTASTNELQSEMR